MQSQQNMDCSARSIFVGNISYDVNEDELRKLLSACGQIVSFRLVHDRETGRPKGFGFCEFGEVPQAEAAIRNFNGFEFRGRPLRVDSATGNDRSADEMQQFQMTLTRPQTGNTEELGPYGPELEPGKAPEVIARTVASMPPEKMFELMRSMKETVNNNPQMARQLLMENPQLSYALLQAQVVMRVVDPKIAYQMLHREHAQPLPPPASAPAHHSQQFSGKPPQIPPQFNVPPPVVPSHQFQMPPPPLMSGQFHHGFPPMMPPPTLMQQQQQQQGPFTQQQTAPGPPMAVSAAAAAPPQQQQATTPSPHAQTAQQSNSDNLDEEQQAQMLVRVLQLTDEQIRMLPPTERAQVIELRNQLRSAGASA
uniref:RRM domain-containing protein n=1 Tax=Globodera rostochiensis TaxID=31243 RepID=A0A914HDN5_GLORO